KNVGHRVVGIYGANRGGDARGNGSGVAEGADGNRRVGPGGLIKRKIEGLSPRGGMALILDIVVDADNLVLDRIAERRIAIGNEFTNGEALRERVHVREVLANEAFVDDEHTGSAG